MSLAIVYIYVVFIVFWWVEFECMQTRFPPVGKWSCIQWSSDWGERARHSGDSSADWWSQWNFQRLGCPCQWTRIHDRWVSMHVLLLHVFPSKSLNFLTSSEQALASWTWLWLAVFIFYDDSWSSGKERSWQWCGPPSADDIDSHIESAHSATVQGNRQLVKAVKSQKSGASIVSITHLHGFFVCTWSLGKICSGFGQSLVGIRSVWKRAHWHVYKHLY